MSDTAQDYKKLLSDALQKQMLILGPQITLLKAHTIPGLSFTNDGQVTEISEDPQKVVTQFLEEFRELSVPLVKKSMKPLLSIILSTTSPQQPIQSNEKAPAEQSIMPNNLKKV